MPSEPIEHSANTEPSSASTDLSLFDLWRSRARRATDAQLAICASVVVPAVVVAVLAALAWPDQARRWWPVASVPMFISAFGLWGIADRERAPGDGRAPSTSPGWRIVEAAAIALAVGSAAIAGLWFLRHVVGTWIS